MTGRGDASPADPLPADPRRSREEGSVVEPVVGRAVHGHTRWLILAVAVGGALAIACAAAAFPPSLRGDLPLKSLVLLVITAASELLAIRLQHGDEAEMITLFELAVVADLVLLPGSLGVIVASGGIALAMVVQRTQALKFVYNFGQYGLCLVAAFAVYHGLGGGSFESDRGLLALTLGLGAFAAVNLITISAILSAREERRLARVLREEGPLSVAIAIGNAAAGIVAVFLYQTRPVLLPFMAGPVVALHLSFRGWIRQKELLRKIEDEKTKLERIVEHASEGIVLADSSGAVVLWSPAMERITGVPEAEAQGKAVSFLLRGRGGHGEPRQVDISSGRALEPLEIEILTAGGEWRWLRVQHGPALAPDGSFAFDVMVVTDVTRQREVDRLKSDFISVVSHELRTPLTPIKGHASLLLRRWEDIPAERRREGLQAIVERVDHMHRLVEDLLLASRVSRDDERRFVEVSLRDFELDRVLEKALNSFRISHPHREFRIDAGPGLVVSADPLRTEQVLVHLISNAVKFSEEGTPVDIGMRRDGARVRMDVRDEGRGIPPDRHEEIFEKFKRLEDPLRMETGGAGLGLFIVRQLTLAMHGEIALDSAIGSGSTFTLWLPAGESAGGMSERQATPA